MAIFNSYVKFPEGNYPSCGAFWPICWGFDQQERTNPLLPLFVGSVWPTFLDIPVWQRAVVYINMCQIPSGYKKRSGESPFLMGKPSKNIYKWTIFQFAMLNNQRVSRSPIPTFDTLCSEQFKERGGVHQNSPILRSYPGNPSRNIWMISPVKKTYRVCLVTSVIIYIYIFNIYIYIQIHIYIYVYSSISKYEHDKPLTPLTSWSIFGRWFWKNPQSQPKVVAMENLQTSFGA